MGLINVTSNLELSEIPLNFFPPPAKSQGRQAERNPGIKQSVDAFHNNFTSFHNFFIIC